MLKGKKFSIGLFLAAAVGLMTAGCGAPANPLVGTWRGQGGGPGGQPAINTITFNADGTLVQTVQMGAKTMVIKATYTTNEGKMRQKLQSVTLDGKPAPATGKTTTDLGYLVNGDELTLGTGSMNNIALKRVEQ